MVRSTHVRETIELLCVILEENGTTPVKAEVLRQAKFDSLDESAPLWQLLYELVRLCELEWSSTQIPKTWKIPRENSNQILYVKKELQKRGYLSWDFATLPANFGNGSRELLLAFSWLMFKEDITGRFKKNSMISLHSDLLYLNKIVEDSCETCVNHNKKQSTLECIQQLLMLNQRLQTCIRLLFSSYLEYPKLSFKIHDATYGVYLTPGHSHLTTKETHLLLHRKELKKMVMLLKQHSHRMENLLLWEEREHIFWEWMESVVDMKSHSTGDMSSSACPGIMFHTAVPPSVVADMVASKDSLARTLLQHESTFDRLETLSDQKETSLELSSHLKSVEEEVALFKSFLGQEMWNMHCFYQELTLKLMKNCGNNKLAAEVSHGQNAKIHEMAMGIIASVHSELQRLKGEEDILAEKLDMLKQQFMHKIKGSLK